jgi:hypothetical protein
MKKLVDDIQNMSQVIITIGKSSAPVNPIKASNKSKTI